MSRIVFFCRAQLSAIVHGFFTHTICTCNTLFFLLLHQSEFLVEVRRRYHFPYFPLEQSLSRLCRFLGSLLSHTHTHPSQCLHECSCVFWSQNRHVSLPISISRTLILDLFSHTLLQHYHNQKSDLCRMFMSNWNEWMDGRTMALVDARRNW
ncbi:hypothetical protein K469DRAFT_339227 [Zopfia rhizophila CBS 207.26]|uniref:Uncharacterized protein n=1 Tax=Zopfia rhizophila CBS 207.26 TaxID=1314779 RepID=A0A6A6DG60_9PEZI|nr:hypothetical protein K469DRAFT_339227 [Zopfia rhizophila CBS 207.26]